jgi:hypothetical protein
VGSRKKWANLIMGLPILIKSVVIPNFFLDSGTSVSCSIRGSFF